LASLIYSLDDRKGVQGRLAAQSKIDEAEEPEEKEDEAMEE